MKKKVLIGFFVFSLFINSIYSSDGTITLNNSLSSVNESIADSEGFANPANLADRDDTSPSLITTFSFLQELKYNQLSTTLGYFQYPKMSMGATVYGTNLGLSINIDSYLEDREYDGDSLNYTGYNRFSIQLDWGYKINDFNFGMRVQGGSVSKRNNFELRSNYLFIPDYIVNTFFSSYTQVANSDFFSLAFSLKFNPYNNLSIAYLTDSNVDLTNETNTNEIISYLKASSIGITYKSNKYNQSNQLNTFVYKGSLDVVYIGESEKRELRLNAEMKMQLANNDSFSIRVGYYEPKVAINDLFVFDFDYGISSYALSYENNDLSIIGIMNLPIISYSDLNNGIEFGINAMFKF